MEIQDSCENRVEMGSGLQCFPGFIGKMLSGKISAPFSWDCHGVGFKMWLKSIEQNCPID